MAIFKRKKATLESELAGLRQRADALDAKRVAAEAELGSATEARQRFHIEGDLDDAKTAGMLQDAVNVAASQIVGFEDAIAAVQAQIAEIEGKLDADRSQADRDAAATKFAAQIAAIEAAGAPWLEATRIYADALSQLAHMHFGANEMQGFLQRCAAQMNNAANVHLAELKPMPSAIREGRQSIPASKPEAAPIAVTEPVEPTRVLFALRSVRWKNAHGEQKVADQYCDAELTQTAAARGLRYSYVVPLDDPRRRELLGVHGGRHPNIKQAIDLDDEAACRPAHIAPVTASDPVLRQADFRVIDRSSDERKIAIAVPRF
jgi:hypothetical protein